MLFVVAGLGLAAFLGQIAAVDVCAAAGKVLWRTSERPYRRPEGPGPGLAQIRLHACPGLLRPSETSVRGSCMTSLFTAFVSCTLCQCAVLAGMMSQS